MRRCGRITGLSVTDLGANTSATLRASRASLVRGYRDAREIDGEITMHYGARRAIQVKYLSRLSRS